MRFVTYGVGDGPDRVGVLDDDDSVSPLGGVDRLIDPLGEPGALRRSGERALGDGTNTDSSSPIVVRAPIPAPPSVRDFMVFEQHLVGTLLNQGPEVKPPKVFYRQPLFYFANPAATIGPQDEVPIPPGSKSFDFELEVAAVVGTPGSNLTVEEALDHIAGYTIMIDWSARDIQFREMQGSLGPAKGKDSATTLGPWLVTPDELSPYANGPSFALDMEVELNGEPFGHDRLDHMGWSFAQMVAYASRGTRLMPGDVLGSGTCGMGCLAEQWGRQGPDQPTRSLQAGDTVTVRVEHLGEMTQHIVAGAPVVDIGSFWTHDTASG